MVRLWVYNKKVSKVYFFGYWWEHLALAVNEVFYVWKVSTHKYDCLVMGNNYQLPKGHCVAKISTTKLISKATNQRTVNKLSLLFGLKALKSLLFQIY